MSALLRGACLVAALFAAACTLGSQPDIPSASEGGGIGTPGIDSGDGTGGASSGPVPCTPELLGGAGGEGGESVQRGGAGPGAPPCTDDSL